MSGLAPWWAAVANGAAPEDGFEKGKAAATAANTAQFQQAIDAMIRKAEGEMLKLLDETPAVQMPRA
jgi:hypothetical protein